MIDPVAPRLSGMDALNEAIATVPIPGAPPQLSRDGAAVGLAFIDVALRQNHVRRLTERLTLVEHRTARCVTEVDISLGLLDAEQKEAGLLYQRMRTHGAVDVNEPGRVMWVPVSLARRTHAPIDVISASGAKLPRLTQFETSRLLASAMYRLFRLILKSHPDAAERPTHAGESAAPHDRLRNFLYRDDRTRWLIQAALVTLLTERNKPAATAELREPELSEDRRCREAAAEIFKEHARSLRDYIGLLDLVVNDYLLVVALDPAQEEHLLAFDAPLHIEMKPRRSFLQWFRMTNGPYWVRYETRLPANLRAYHLVAETAPDLEIDTMCLTTDADESVVQSLREDLSTLSQRLRAEPAAHRVRSTRAGQKVELELWACLGRLAELLRRRAWDASRINMRLPRLPVATNLAQAVRAGAGRDTDDSDVRLSDHRSVTPDTLAKAAKELARHRLGHDFSVENEPPGQRSHVYWRRAPSRVDSARYITVSASMFIRDIGGQRSASMTAYVLSVVAIAYALAGLRFGTPWPFAAWFPDGFQTPVLDQLIVHNETNVAAAITVMLLVPGFLYTRLNLPQRHTIAGQLRRLPRLVAHVTIVAAAAVATAFASQHDMAIQIALTFCVWVPLVLVLLVHLLSRRIARERLPVTSDTPLWARQGRPLGREVRRRLAQSIEWRLPFRTPDSSFRTTWIQPDAVGPRPALDEGGSR